jgi:hypothetical protein
VALVSVVSVPDKTSRTPAWTSLAANDEEDAPERVRTDDTLEHIGSKEETTNKSISGQRGQKPRLSLAKSGIVPPETETGAPSKVRFDASWRYRPDPSFWSGARKVTKLYEKVV